MKITHSLKITDRAAKLACGPDVIAYYPTKKKALLMRSDEKISVTFDDEMVTCDQCAAALTDPRRPR